MKIPSIVIAGTNSGCGKTTVSTGIMAALVEKGIKVQPYKVGPDYIDPMFHTFVTGRESRNLDSWMIPEKPLRYLFARNSKDTDIAVIEGVMGLYDGYSGKSTEGSTAHVAAITGAPVILVVNCEAMTLSAAALVKGFSGFDKKVKVKGVIINNISGEEHYKLLKEAIEKHTGILVLGYLKRTNELAIAERHLGLVTSAEIPDIKEKAAILSRQIQETVDIEMLLKLSLEADEINIYDMGTKIEKVGNARIAVAKDKAFCFYYKDNLELLEMLGAKIIYFSPLNDERLPEGIDGLYFGGGYPEVWASELQRNASMRRDIKKMIESGLPAYAECGGLMYLSGSISCREGTEWEMAGLIPGKSRMTDSLKRFGYVFVKLKEDTILGKKGSEIRSHEFHYSETLVDENVKECYEVSRTKDRLHGKCWKCGYKVYNLLAGYPHMHFWSNIEFARSFVKSCVELNSKGKGV